MEPSLENEGSKSETKNKRMWEKTRPQEQQLNLNSSIYDNHCINSALIVELLHTFTSAVTEFLSAGGRPTNKTVPNPYQTSSSIPGNTLLDWAG